MKLLTPAAAGTLESSDIMITLEPVEDGGLMIELNSVVEKQFGDVIRAEIRKTLSELGVEHARVNAVDKGALDCTIRARVKTAVFRSAQSEDYPWGGGAR